MSSVHAVLSHSTRDANKDITNVINYFLEKKVAHEIPKRTSIGFKDPRIKDTLSRTECLEDTIYELTECNQDYELFDVT